MKKLIKTIKTLSEYIKIKHLNEKIYDNLSYEQFNVFSNIINFISFQTSFLSNTDKNNICSLNARAGTGKTYLLTSLIKYYTNINNEIIIVSSPTHKSLNVIKNMLLKKNIDINLIKFKTIHKLIKARPFYNEHGELDFDIDILNTSFKDKNVICLIDEGGMINKKCFEGLLQLIEKIKGKIIFFSDNFQLPPINEISSMVSEIKNSFTLNKIHRIKQKGLYQVYELFASFVIQKKFNRKHLKKLIKENNDISIIMQKDLKHILEENKSIINDVKLICFRNITRKKWNDKIRKILYPNITNKIIIGEQLITNTTFYYNEREIYSSHFIEVKNIELQQRNLNNINFLCYIINSDLEDEELSIIHEKSEKKFKSLKTILRENIIENIENPNLDISDEWDLFYKQINYIDCPLDYSYAITTHKSQGSTFKIVLVDLFDILTARMDNDDTYNIKMLYTAITRSSHKVFLII